jgi:hypothetical protein
MAGIGFAQHRFYRPRPVQRVRPRKIVIGGNPEFENGRRKRLGNAYQGVAFIVGSPAVLGDDDGVGGARENLSHPVDMFWRRDNRCGGNPRGDVDVTFAHQQLKRYLQQRGAQRDGLGDEAGAPEFMNQIGRRARSLRPLDDGFGIAGRTRMVGKKRGPFGARVGVRVLTIGECRAITPSSACVPAEQCSGPLFHVVPVPGERFPYRCHHGDGRGENAVHALRLQLLQQYFRAILRRICACHAL